MIECVFINCSEGRRLCSSSRLWRRSFPAVALTALSMPAFADAAADGLAKAKAESRGLYREAGVQGPGRRIRCQGLRRRQEDAFHSQQQRQSLPERHHRPREGGRGPGRPRGQGMGEPGTAEPVGAGRRARDPREVRHHRSHLGHRPGDDRAAAAGGQGGGRQGDDVAFLRPLLHAPPGGFELADDRFRRDRQDPRRLGDGRDRRQGQHRHRRVQRGAADHPAGRQLQEGARRRQPAARRSSRRSMSA